eukprot:CAMPEP_0115719024 /NCGR_PEP_ID=MMETSP0272-20121206/77752_1 /TAXON_ID=71861 /ORGANISM="Scrippsiella trochoidea, Strain CCMP3099" /LENGTH=97 /DNA_ID=CAMNT_0003161609 /DNA_START=210 /DNA_END=500 /DNA_ORIENTATION=+
MTSSRVGAAGSGVTAQASRVDQSAEYLSCDGKLAGSTLTAALPSSVVSATASTTIRWEGVQERVDPTQILTPLFDDVEGHRLTRHEIPDYDVQDLEE